MDVRATANAYWVIANVIRASAATIAVKVSIHQTSTTTTTTFPIPIPFVSCSYQSLSTKEHAVFPSNAIYAGDKVREREITRNISNKIENALHAMQTQITISQQ